MSITIPRAELMDITKLKVDGQNPNRMTDKQLARLKTSIEKYGFIVPIITNKDLLVADGEQRLKAARDLGLNKVSIIRLDVQDVDRRLLRQVLNKLRGEHELISDAHEFQRIIEAGHEDELKHLLDLSDSQLERYLAEIREPKEETYEIPEIDKIQTDIQRGEIYQLGTHRLMCGDATSQADVEALMNGEKADMIFTDPPYFLDLGVRSITGKYISGEPRRIVKEEWDRFETVSNYTDFTEKWLVHMASNLNLYGHLVSFFDWKRMGLLIEKAQQNSLYFPSLIVWEKTSVPPSFRKRSFRNVIEVMLWFNKKPNEKLGGKYTFNFQSQSDMRNSLKFDPIQSFATKDIITHNPAQKPTELLSHLIRVFTNKKELIVDPFGGSGSTLIACEQTGRRCFMMEIDRRYCQVIINRWENYTGQKAEKLE